MPTAGLCKCGHFDGEHFDEVKACACCECAAYRSAISNRQSTPLDKERPAR